MRPDILVFPNVEIDPGDPHQNPGFESDLRLLREMCLQRRVRDALKQTNQLERDIANGTSVSERQSVRFSYHAAWANMLGSNAVSAHQSISFCRATLLGIYHTPSELAVVLCVLIETAFQIDHVAEGITACREVLDIFNQMTASEQRDYTPESTFMVLTYTEFMLAHGELLWQEPAAATRSLLVAISRIRAWNNLLNSISSNQIRTVEQVLPFLQDSLPKLTWDSISTEGQILNELWLLGLKTWVEYLYAQIRLTSSPNYAMLASTTLAFLPDVFAASTHQNTRREFLISAGFQGIGMAAYLWQFAPNTQRAAHLQQGKAILDHVHHLLFAIHLPWPWRTNLERHYKYHTYVVDFLNTIHDFSPGQLREPLTGAEQLTHHVQTSSVMIPPDLLQALAKNVHTLQRKAQKHEQLHLAGQILVLLANFALVNGETEEAKVHSIAALDLFEAALREDLVLGGDTKAMYCQMLKRDEQP